MTTNGTSRTIGSVEKACRIIDLLEERDSIGVQELADELEITKGTAHCYLATLVQHNYAIKSDGRYRLSLRYLALGQAVKQRIDIYDLVRGELVEIADEFDERVQFYMEEGGKAVYVARETPERSVKSSIGVGGSEYMHCVSGGKAMLAHYPRDRITDIVDTHGLEEYTEHTITDREELFEHLAEIREQGYAIHDEERAHGIRCIAVPVLPDSSDVLGAISVCGPVSRMDEERLENEILNRLRQSANLIEVNSTLPYGD